MDDFAATWYSAVPTMHQAVLRAVESHRHFVERSRLRFVRSSSAALPAPVKAELEKVFNVPVIEAYGMTEAAHQIASNPLPPKERKPGCVGLAAGPQIAVMDQAGNLIPTGQTGEIVIRGTNVFQGYENNQTVSADAFTDGWFRTGDQGHLDADGYLFITGRLKDIINRGGEKISPAEVDEVLLNHPAIEQAITFPVPHPTLGEDVRAAVVLRQRATVSEKEVRVFVAARIAGFKVPQRVLIVEEIPKGPTGKIQRRIVAEKLGLVDSNDAQPRSVSTYAAPAGTLEHQLVQLWEELLQARPIGVRDNFFELGGDSLLAIQMMLRVEKIVGMQVPLTTLLANPTVEQLGHGLMSQRFETGSSLLAKVHAGGTQRPLFFLHGDIVGGGFYSLNLARALGADRPFYVLSPHGLNREPVPKSVEEMAASYVQIIRTVEREGPYLLGGYCRGGIVSFEIARQLQQQGQKVALLLLIAAVGWNSRYRLLRLMTKGAARLIRLTEDQRLALFEKWRTRLPFSDELRCYYLNRIRCFARLPFKEQLTWVLRTIGKTTERSVSLNREQIDFRTTVIQGHAKALEGYVPKSYAGHIALLWPVEDPVRLAVEWKRVVPQIEIRKVPGHHTDCITTYVRNLGDCMKAALDKIDLRGGSGCGVR
jgi:oxalate---CoA ligase